MANLENFKLLRKTIAELEPTRINLDRYWTSVESPSSCGFAGCVAGWAVALATKENPMNIHRILWFKEIAVDWLDIPNKEYFEIDLELWRYDHHGLFSTAKYCNHKREALDRLDICIAYLEKKQNEN